MVCQVERGGGGVVWKGPELGRSVVWNDGSRHGWCDGGGSVDRGRSHGTTKDGERGSDGKISLHSGDRDGHGVRGEDGGRARSDVRNGGSYREADGRRGCVRDAGARVRHGGNGDSRGGVRDAGGSGRDGGRCTSDYARSSTTGLAGLEDDGTTAVFTAEFSLAAQFTTADTAAFGAADGSLLVGNTVGGADIRRQHTGVRDGRHTIG